MEVEINDLPRGPRTVIILPNLDGMSPDQKAYYVRELDVWGHIYRHREHGRWVMVYQGERPTDWEWEEAQETNRRLRQQLREAEVINRDLVDELMRLRTRVRELEGSVQVPSPPLAAPHGWGLGRGLGRGLLGWGNFKPPPGF